MLLENVGHTIQKILNNTPIAIATNPTISAIATSGGDIYLSGLINNKIQASFEDIVYNNDLLGKAVDIKAAENSIYILNSDGYVYEYRYNYDNCKQFYEVYSPRECCGDKAIKIAAGRDHVVILTENNRVFGAGDNSEYQIVPHGQCRYECATEIVITDVNIHDDCCCDKFSGFLNFKNTPVLPRPSSCGKTVCLNETRKCVPILKVCINNVTRTCPVTPTPTPTPPHPCPCPFDQNVTPTPITSFSQCGCLCFPILADIDITGTPCVNTDGTVSGFVTLKVTSIYLPGCVCPNGCPLPAEFNLGGQFIVCGTNNAIPVRIAFGPTGVDLTTLLISFFPPHNAPIPPNTRCVNDQITVSLDLIDSNLSSSTSISNTIANIISDQLPDIPNQITDPTGNIINLTLFPSSSAPVGIELPGPCGSPQNDQICNILNNLFPVAILAQLTIPPVAIPAIPLLATDGCTYTLFNCACARTITRTGTPPTTHCVIPAPTVSVTLLPIDITICCPKDKRGDCCGKEFEECCPIPQPCWRNVYAGFDITILLDTCNRLYALGTLHEIRSNKHLYRKGCLEDLLNNANATITFPADELNCCTRPRNGKCGCPKCKDKCFKTDLSKFGIQLNFANGYCIEERSCECNNETALRAMKNNINVCDFLEALKNCNEYPNCEDTCEPCDTTVYFNVCGTCGCPCGSDIGTNIGSITLYNKKSICKLLALQKRNHCPNNGLHNRNLNNNGSNTNGLNTISVPVGVGSLIEFDLNRFCIDANDYPLDSIIVLQLNTGGSGNVDMYFDICKFGSIKLISCNDTCFDKFDDYAHKSNKRFNVDFPVNTNDNAHFLLNYGGVLDPVELANLRVALGLSCAFYCPCYLNPSPNRVISAYLKGGDRVRFVLTNVPGRTCGAASQFRFPITADVPTVFLIKRRVLDVAVGDNNLSVLVGGVACPNEILAIGQNCYGELGLNGTSVSNNETVLCFKKLNRCLFDCQVERIFAGKHVTFYITQSYRVYAAGNWKCLHYSNIPVCVPHICQGWKIVNISVSKNHILLLGRDGCLFGLGDNSLGELGLCHTKCVKKPVSLAFLDILNNGYVNRFKSSSKHPLLKGFDKYCKTCYCYPCKCVPCTPCPSYCEKDDYKKDDSKKDDQRYKKKQYTKELEYYEEYDSYKKKSYSPNSRCCGKKY